MISRIVQEDLHLEHSLTYECVMFQCSFCLNVSKCNCFTPRNRSIGTSCSRKMSFRAGMLCGHNSVFILYLWSKNPQ